MTLDSRLWQTALVRISGAATLALAVAISAAADVTLFGSKTYPVTSGAPVTVTDAFSANSVCDGSPRAVYTLSLTNSGVSSAVIAVNGTTIVGPNDLNQQVTTVERTIALLPSNSVAVTVNGGKSDGGLTISIRRHIDVSSALFGPKSYVAANGGAAAHDAFSVTDFNASYTLVVRNGTPDGKSQPKSISIALNGVPVIGPADFANTSVVTKAIAPEGTNDLAVTTSGNNGDVVTVTVVQHLADRFGPAVTLSGIADGDVVAATPVTIRGSVADPSGVSSLTIAGAPVTVAADGTFSTAVTLAGGANRIAIDALDCEGNASHRALNLILSTAPVVMITVPRAYGAVQPGDVVVSGTAIGGSGGIASVDVNGTPATLNGSSWSVTLSFGGEGLHDLTATATDGAGKTATATSAFYTDATPPSITGRILTPVSASGWIAGFAFVQFDCSDALSGLSECTGRVMVTDEGAGQVVNGTAVDPAGNRANASVTVNVDLSAPLLTVDKVVSATKTPTVKSPSLTLTGTVSDAVSGVASVTCNGASGTINGGAFTCAVTLQEGANLIAVNATDRAGNVTRGSANVTLDRQAPTLALGAPETPGLIVGTAAYTVVGYASDESGVSSVAVNGQSVALVKGKFTFPMTLAEGVNAINVTAIDNVGNTATLNSSIKLVTAVHVAITSPADLIVTNVASVTVSGTVTPPNASVVVNGLAASVSNGAFSVPGVPLWQGRTPITATATSIAGTVGTAAISVYRDSIPPRLAIYSPAADGDKAFETPISVTGMVDDVVVGTINGGQVSVTVNGVAATVSNRAFIANGITLAAGTNTIIVVATDQGGNRATATRSVVLDTLAGQAKIARVSGGGQQAAIGTQLSQPLVVKLLDASGRVVAGKPVVFAIAQNNGVLTGGGASSRSVTVQTDTKGLASATWKLGTRAGAGNNRVVATAAGFSGSVEFDAVATTGAPAHIVVDSGNSQFGVVSDRLARPLIACVVDAGGNRIGNVPVTFSVVDGGGSIGGSASVVVTSDSDGRAWVVPTLGPDAGNDNNVFAASIGTAISPAVFLASGRVAGSPSATRIVGVVLDNTDIPIAGVSVRVDGAALSTQTNAQGQFVIAAAPVGYVKLIIDGSTAQRAGTWPTLEYVMYTNPGSDNNVGMPIHILPIDVQRGIQVDERKGGTLTLPELPGFSMTIAPGSALFPNGSRAGTVSVTLVHSDKMPMTPGFGQQPRFLVTIQPTGVHFDPPAAISFPNVDGLAPGEVTEMYSFDHDLGQFVSIGTGSITEDGSVLKSDPGVGIIKGGWHCGGNPTTTGGTSCVHVALNVAGTAKIGNNVDVTATGTPPGGTFVNWEIVDDPNDPNDDPTIASFVTQPTCAGAATCTAQLKPTLGGTLSVRVSYQPASTTLPGSPTKSDIKKVRIPALQVKALMFLSGHTILKDIPGQAVPLPIGPTHWVDTLSPFIQEPAAYTRSQTNSTHKLPVKVQFSAKVGAAGLNGVTIDGKGGGFTFHQENVNVAPGSDHTDWLTIDSNEDLPTTTKYYNPLKIDWTYTISGDSTQVPAGSTVNPVYVTLKDPIQTVYYTSLNLGVSIDGASDEGTALSNTWSQFAGPSDVKNWKNDPLYYYRPTPNGQTPPTGFQCATTEVELLTRGDESGQCGSFARLLQGALAANGVHSQWVTALANGASNTTLKEKMMVKNWTLDPGSASLTETDGFNWHVRIYDNPYSDYMVPLPPTGDVENVDGVAGQNSHPNPSEKIFDSHFVIAAVLNGQTVTPFLDASYGVTYKDGVDFEAKALDGYLRKGPDWTITVTNGTTQTTKPVPGWKAKPSTGMKNVTFYLGAIN